MLLREPRWEGSAPPEVQVLRGKKRTNKVRGPLAEGGANAEASKATTVPTEAN